MRINLPSIRHLEDRPYLKKIIANTGWLFLDKVLRMGIGLVIGVWVARYLGPEQFGLFSYALAFVALFTAIATLGLDGIVVRDMVRKPDDIRETLGSAFILKLMGGFITLGLALGIISLMRSDEPQICWLVGIIAAGTIFQACDTVEFWFQAQVNSKYTVYAKNIAFIIVSILKVFLIIMGAPLMFFAWAGLGEVALGALGVVLVYRNRGPSISEWQATLARGRDLLKNSWPLIFSGVVTMIYMRIDQVMLGQMVGNKEVGIYSAAVRLAEVWYFIPMAVVPSVFPSIVQAKEISEELFYQRLQKLYNLMALLAYTLAIPTTLLAGGVVNLLYGPSFSKAGPMLGLLIWAGLFVNLGVARTSFLTTMNWTKVHFMTTSLGCAINVALNWILIPKYGGMGAVIASIIAYAFAAYGACFIYRPLFRTGVMLSMAILIPIGRSILCFKKSPEKF